MVFGLRGMKTNMGDPHRNLVDFAHVPVVKRLTRMPVRRSLALGRFATSLAGRHPRHAACHRARRTGRRQHGAGGFPPAPPKALVDGPQALLLKELPYFLEDVQIAREAYLKRVALRQKQE